MIKALILAALAQTFIADVADSALWQRFDPEHGFSYHMSTPMGTLRYEEEIGVPVELMLIMEAPADSFRVEVPYYCVGHQAQLAIMHTGPLGGLAHQVASEVVTVPEGGIMWMDISPHRVPYMTFWVTFMLPNHMYGAFWKVER